MERKTRTNSKRRNAGISFGWLVMNITIYLPPGSRNDAVMGEEM
jgi:hypothetical protein